MAVSHNGQVGAYVTNHVMEENNTGIGSATLLTQKMVVSSAPVTLNRNKGATQILVQVRVVHIEVFRQSM